MIAVYCDEKLLFKIDSEGITIRELYEIAKQEGKADYQIACFFHRESEDVDCIDFDDKAHTVHI